MANPSSESVPAVTTSLTETPQAIKATSVITDLPSFGSPKAQDRSNETSKPNETEEKSSSVSKSSPVGRSPVTESLSNIHLDSVNSVNSVENTEAQTKDSLDDKTSILDETPIKNSTKPREVASTPVKKSILADRSLNSDQPITPLNRVTLVDQSFPTERLSTGVVSESALSSISSSCGSLSRTDSSSSITTNTAKDKTGRSKDKVQCEFRPSFDIEGIEDLEMRSNDPKTWGDYVKVLGIIAAIPVVVAKDSLYNTFASKERRRQIGDAAIDSMMGHCYKSSTSRQLRISTGRHPMKTELKHPLYFFMGDSWGLPNYNKDFSGPGFVARWICEIPDRKPEDPVLVYYHGGGFAMKIAHPQVEYICGLAKRLLKRRVSVMASDYTITPFARFPVQRKQASACMSMSQRSCKNIMLMGDSCGGNLALSVSLEENNPQVSDHKNVTACMLVSPWVDPDASTGSMHSGRDILSLKRLQEMTKSFVTTEQLQDPRVSPIRADPAVWERVLPKNTCMVWGDWECLNDQDVAFQKLANVSNYYVEKNGTHDCILRGSNPKPCRYITEQLLSWVPDPNPKPVEKPAKSSKSRHSILRTPSMMKSPSSAKVSHVSKSSSAAESPESVKSPSSATSPDSAKSPSSAKSPGVSRSQSVPKSPSSPASSSPMTIAKRSSQLFIRKLSTRRSGNSPRRVRSMQATPTKGSQLIAQGA